MKPVILSADGPSKVYLVPDRVADNLEEWCWTFCSIWLPSAPEAAKYRVNNGLCYNEDDFIEYLNAVEFPEEPSMLVEQADWNTPIPEIYAGCPRFDF